MFLGLILISGDGGVVGVESCWQMELCYMWGLNNWDLKWLCVWIVLVKDWFVMMDGCGFVLVGCKKIVVEVIKVKNDFEKVE